MTGGHCIWMLKENSRIQYMCNKSQQREKQWGLKTIRMKFTKLLTDIPPLLCFSVLPISSLIKERHKLLNEE